MTRSRVPDWVWWAAGTVILWTAWGLLPARILLHSTGELMQKRQAMENDIRQVESRIAAIPQSIDRLRTTHSHLDTTLGSFYSPDRCDALIEDVRSDARNYGLTDITVDPDLEALLSLTNDEDDHRSRDLDTLILEISASGAFVDIGQWLDQVEKRTDFRHWMSCRWSAGDDNARVGFTGRTAILVVNRGGLVENDSGTVISYD